MTAVDGLTTSASRGVVDLEATRALPALDEIPPLGVRCLVRAWGRPIGVVDLPGTSTSLDAAAVTAAVQRELGPVIDRARAAAPADGASGSGATGDGITVAIATRDRPATLARCIDSVLAGTCVPAAIVIVDNAPSSDETQRLVADAFGHDPRIRYFVEPRPGLGRAHNAALPSITTPYVAFTDDDVLVDARWVEVLGEAFLAAPDVACVTGLIAPAELLTQEQWWIERSTGFSKGFERRIRSLRTAASEGPLFPYDAGTFGSGANMAFSMAFLREIGGFDPALGTGTGSLGGDDLAALHQVVARGHDLVYEPGAVVFHKHHHQLAALERQARGYGAGLTAYLASVVAHRPGAAVDIARRSLSGVGHVLRPGSELNQRRDDDYPGSLVWRERWGMVSGPVRYARQRRRDQRTDRASS
ncbi:MAG: pgaC 1 [Ilumatobacteraceae bacterium]|nr:pgaC 1 [Ilumatobacteraceae bacterium]